MVWDSHTPFQDNFTMLCISIQMNARAHLTSVEGVLPVHGQGNKMKHESI